MKNNASEALTYACPLFMVIPIAKVTCWLLINAPVTAHRVDTCLSGPFTGVNIFRTLINIFGNIKICISLKRMKT